MRSRFPKYLAKDVSFFGLKLNDIMYIAGSIVFLSLFNPRIEILFLLIIASVSSLFLLRKHFPRNYLRHFIESKEKIKFRHFNYFEKKK